MKRFLFLFVLLNFMALCHVNNSRANSYNVTTNGDTGAGSFRDALVQANSVAGPHTITFNIALSGSTINLTTALPNIDVDVTITGPALPAIVKNNTAVVFGILRINSGKTVAVSNLVFSDGKNGGIYNDGGNLSLTTCSVINSAGTGIYSSSGNLTLTNCNILNNRGGSNGGGLGIEAFSGSQTITISNSTISGNRANSGGGLYILANAANVTISNSTFSLDTASSGGAVYLLGAASFVVNNSTIAYNYSNSFIGGIYKVGSTTPNLSNSILIGNSQSGTPSDAYGNINSTNGHNIVGTINTGTLGGTDNITGVLASEVLNPVLANNGGTTVTHALVTCSYAIDAGTATGSPATDQRGTSRSGTVDIGAYESAAGATGKSFFTTSPVSISKCGGTGHTFTVVTTSGTPTYQWQLKEPSGSFTNLSNTGVYSSTATASLVISDVAGLHNNQYRCIATNGSCSATTSSAATLSVPSAPTVTVQPYDFQVCVGSNADFFANGSATGGITLQWQKYNGASFVDLTNSAPYSGVTTNSFTINSISNSLDSAQFRCAFTNTCGNTTYTNAVKSFVVTTVAVTSQPSALGICSGSGGSIDVGLSEPIAHLTFTWQYFNGSSYQTLSNDSYQDNYGMPVLYISNAPVALDGKIYRLKVDNSCDASVVFSNPATLTVSTAPAVNSHPSPVNTCLKSTTASFSVSATSGLTPTYQWQYKKPSGIFINASNNSNFSGVTTSSLTIASAEDSLNGWEFRCTITNSCGSTTSNNAALTLTTGISISAQPENILLCSPGSYSTFVTATGASNYQWQENAGSGFTNITNNGTYSGAQTSSLAVNVTSALLNYQYRCVLTSSGCALATLNSNTASIIANSPPSVTTQPTDKSACENAVSPTNISFNTTGNVASMQWQVDNGSGFNDISNGTNYSGTTGNNLSILTPPASFHNNYYRCKITDPCSNVINTNAVLLKINSTSISFSTQPSDQNALPASTASFTVATSGQNVVYQWQVNTGSGFSNITNNSVYSNSGTASLSISNITAGMNGYLYRCAASNACASTVFSNSAALLVTDLKICMVTNDASTGKNKVIFDKPADKTGIDSFFIYKETAVTGVYAKTGGLDVDDLSEFEDVNSNAAQQAYSYKVSINYTNNTESSLSSAHKTMHLTINQGINNTTWNLIWTAYQGVSVSTYNIYRGTSAGSLSLIGAVSGASTSFTDNNAPVSSNLFYQVEIVGTSCNSTAKIGAGWKTSANYSSIRSNVADTQNATTGVTGNSERDLLKIYPNPARDIVSIEGLSNDYSIKIRSMEGAILKEQSNHNTVDLTGLSKGIYLLEIIQSGKNTHRKLIVE